jgi:hypothetical protein
MPDSPRRGIIREHEFEMQLSALVPNLEEADDFVAAAEDLLSDDPSIGMPLSTDDIWILPMAPIRGADVWLYYRFDERTVVFLAILPFD